MAQAHMRYPKEPVLEPATKEKAPRLALVAERAAMGQDGIGVLVGKKGDRVRRAHSMRGARGGESSVQS